MQVKAALQRALLSNAAFVRDNWTRIRSKQQMAVAAAAAVAAAVGVPDGTRNDEAVTGAAEAPVVTIVVEDSQLMPTLPQSGASASHRLRAPEESVDALEAQIVATTKLYGYADSAADYHAMSDVAAMLMLGPSVGKHHSRHRFLPLPYGEAARNL